MPDPLEEKRKKEAAAPFHPGDVVLVISRQQTGSVRKVDVDREMLKVAVTHEPIEIPFADAQVVISARPPKDRHRPRFDNGQEVRITDGPFANFIGIVEDVFANQERLRVTVRIAGRPTVTELAFSQVERT